MDLSDVEPTLVTRTIMGWLLVIFGIVGAIVVILCKEILGEIGSAVGKSMADNVPTLKQIGEMVGRQVPTISDRLSRLFRLVTASVLSLAYELRHLRAVFGECVSPHFQIVKQPPVVCRPNVNGTIHQR